VSTVAGYRQRVYERYASVFKAAAPIDLAPIDLWGGAYDVYLAGWLPEISPAGYPKPRKRRSPTSRAGRAGCCDSSWCAAIEI